MGNVSCTSANPDIFCASLGQPCGMDRKASQFSIECGLANLQRLSEMNVLEFEQRVKRYASPQGKGFINEFQLMEAFSDTNIFSHLADPSSSRT